MKLTYAIFYTKDIKAITKFYEQTLGFKKTFEDDRFVAFKLGDAFLGIKVSESSREIPGHQTVSIEVDDIDNLFTTLNKKNVHIEKTLTTENWGQNFSVLDSDLNKVEFFQK